MHSVHVLQTFAVKQARRMAEAPKWQFNLRMPPPGNFPMSIDKHVEVVNLEK